MDYKRDWISNHWARFEHTTHTALVVNEETIWLDFRQINWTISIHHTTTNVLPISARIDAFLRFVCDLLSHSSWQISLACGLLIKFTSQSKWFFHVAAFGASDFDIIHATTFCEKHLIAFCFRSPLAVVIVVQIDIHVNTYLTLYISLLHSPNRIHGNTYSHLRVPLHRRFQDNVYQMLSAIKSHPQFTYEMVDNKRRRITK